MKYFLLGFLLFTLSNSACSEEEVGKNPEVPVNKNTNLEIYLLIGQSNMAGRAEIEIQDEDSLTNVLLFTGITGKEWEKAANPLNKYSTVRKELSLQKLGPGYTFARKMAEANPGKTIGLVVNARGGTALSEWIPGENLYNEAVKRAKAAMKYGVVKGIVWHQGESDVSKSDIYLDKLALMIEKLRADLGNSAIPFVAGQLSEARPERKVFNQMILLLPNKVAKTGVATSEGTATIDSTHFDSPGQRLLGERYATEMLKLLK
jgi:hypothetical protein